MPKPGLNAMRKKNYYAIDPVLMLCQQPGRGLEWTHELFTGAGDLWKEAQEHGLNSGFSCSAMASNRAIGILSIASHLASRTHYHHVELEVKLHFLAELSLRSLQRFSDDALMVLKNDFSQRELEILKWTAEGKTSAEISLILAISQHTVNFHQKKYAKAI
ncbi:autoinducer binding domain-containing protein [Pantoea tagorei]